MRRISIYILFAFSAWTGVAAFDHYFSKADWTAYYRKTFAHRVDLLSSEGIVAESFWQARQNFDELKDFLESRRRLDTVSFWAVIGPSGVTQSGLAGKGIDDIGFDLEHPHESIVRKGNIFYETENLSPGTHLVLGLIFDEEAFFKHQSDLVWVSLVEYLAGVFTIVLAVFVFFFRDIINSVRQLKKKGAKSYAQGKVHSREADLLIHGLSAYDKKGQELEREKEILSAQVLPSLRTELRSGRPPPYEFSCTLARSDINNFSKIYNNFPVEPFAETINEFFTEVSHIVSRYNGLIHEFIGDEVIFYFKDEDVGNSVAAAVSAIREINLVAARYHASTLKERGYPFTIKSTLAHGQLRFGRFVNGYGLAGPSLIETVRVISQVNEKDGNVVVFDERHIPMIESIGEFEPYATVKLKGFTDEKKLVLYRGHHALVTVLGSKEPGKFADLECFRSDDDLVTILNWAKENPQSETANGLSKLIGVLRKVPVTRTDGKAQQLLLEWIESLTSEILRVDGSLSEFKVRILSSVLRLTENLVPRAEFTDRFEAALKSTMEIKDRRVIANALESLTMFRKEYEPGLSERLARHPDNRVAANALLHEGLRQISPFVVKRLQKMLGSRNVANMASALYALGEISAFHREQDSVYYGTQIDFLKLVKWIPALAANDDAMVRRQALIAARKCGDNDVVDSICRSVNERGDAGRIAEIRTYLGERHTLAKAA